MLPKEKAQGIYNKIWDSLFSDTDIRNISAIETTKGICNILIDEVIEQWDYIDTYLADDGGNLNPNLKYWYDVKAALITL